jgi:hypothetical protein
MTAPEAHQPLAEIAEWQVKSGYHRLATCHLAIVTWHSYIPNREFQPKTDVPLAQ